MWIKRIFRRQKGVENITQNIELTEISQRPSAEESLQKLTSGLGHMLEQLDSIGTNLDRQTSQNEKLIDSISHLPNILEEIPAHAQSQKEAIDAAISQIHESSANNQRVADALEKIPTVAAKQAQAFFEVKDQLQQNGETHEKMLDGFFKFNDNLEDLSSNSACQNDNLLRLGKSFASSERYFKYMLDKQSKRFMWVFIISMVVSLSCVALAGWIAIKVVAGQ